MHNFLSEMLNKLTHNYNKSESGNIGKLLNIITSELEEIETAISLTGNYRDIDQAQGATLDRIGLNIEQYRGVSNDAIYRILLKSKIARNLSTGDINTIIRILAVTLNIAPENILVTELYNSTEPEPAAVFISVPTESLNQIGFSINQFGRLVNRIVAAGVRAKVFFEGTFSFSSQPATSEFESTKGFADIAQTTGGILGAIYDPANDTELPI